MLTFEHNSGTLPYPIIKMESEETWEKDMDMCE